MGTHGVQTSLLVLFSFAHITSGGHLHEAHGHRCLHCQVGIF